MQRSSIQTKVADALLQLSMTERINQVWKTDCWQFQLCRKIKRKKLKKMKKNSTKWVKPLSQLSQDSPTCLRLQRHKILSWVLLQLSSWPDAPETCFGPNSRLLSDHWFWVLLQSQWNPKLSFSNGSNDTESGFTIPTGVPSTSISLP